MFQVAVYGKGGIGKSTITANVSVELARTGRRVMQLGCDPKHDSTRLLLGGRTQTTVLDYVRAVPLARRRLGDVVEEGAMGVLCTEAGGPEPGIGCAGRGILTTFDTLRKLGVDGIDADFRIYDVLGDVVCGGFAVPLRGEYADAVLLVTSGEFMAMYAANNIMRGMLNFDTGSPRLLGIVLNSRGVEGESESVRAFAEATGTRVIAEIPRHRLFADAEARGHTVCELYPDSEVARAMAEVAEAVARASEDHSLMTTPTPLDDLQLSDLAAGRPIRPPSGGTCMREGCGGCARRTTIGDSRVMSSCAAYGAVAAFLRLDDVAVVLHGPRSCMYLMGTTRGKAVLELFARGMFATKPNRNLRSTCMDDAAAVFGGDSYLSWAVDRAVSEGYREVAVVTTCVPGIIGDDCLSVMDAASRRHPDVRFHLVQTDGDVTGDFNDGFQMAVESMVETMYPDLQRDMGLVNLVGQSFFDMQSRVGLESLETMLSVFGLRVNCRFLDESTSETVRRFCRAGTDILINGTPRTAGIMALITRRTGREPFPVPLPIGLYEYQEWVSAMGEHLGMEVAAMDEVRRSQNVYDRFVESHRTLFEGRRIMIYCRLSTSVDWLADMLGDLGADLVKVVAMTSPTGSPNRFGGLSADYAEADLDRDLEVLRPEMLVSDIPIQSRQGVRQHRISRMGVGYLPTLEYAERLGNALRLPERDGWRDMV